jgi:hypothetical protein
MEPLGLTRLFWTEEAPKMPVINTIQSRRDTAANWTSVNPILAAGELGLETDSTRIKFGNGTSTWTALPYASGGGVTASDTAPADPVVGDQWLDTTTGKTYIYYDGYWIEMDSNGTSATSTGNAIINGAFDIWQRGTSFTNPSGSTFYWADRWLSSGAALWTATKETFSPADLTAVGYGEGENFLKITVNGASTSTAAGVSQRIEDVRTFAGQTVTLSFWTRGSVDRTFNATLAQNFGSGGSTTVTSSQQSFGVSTSWNRVSLVFSLPSISGKTIGSSSFLQLNIRLGTVPDGNYDIWGVQLEAGSVATPFRRNANSLQGELAACQRYFAALGSGAVGRAILGTQCQLNLTFPTTMRAAPTLAFGGNFNFTEVNVSARTATDASLFASSTTGASFNLTTSGLTLPNMVFIISANNLLFSAEL